MKHFYRKTLNVMLTGALIVSAASCSRRYSAKSEEDIIGFLSDCGISVAGDCTRKTVTIPAEFGDVYEKYNELQKQQGFDLSRYRSREAEVYTYSVISVDGGHTEFTEAHVMVCDETIIGGDISSAGLGGEMQALVKK
ncbi:MAG: DUF4830 domain-containing protein [Ruminiclostridium sp.]|nr:DUF4830 domain-containing protein [Ruminiclostridium sp.]